MDFDNEEGNQRGLADYLRVLKRRWRIGALGFAVVLVGGSAIAMLLPSVYRSSATILIEQQEIPQDFVRSMITSFASQRIQLISQQVMTTSNLLEIINRYDLYVDERRSEPREVIIDRMRENIGLNMISADVVDPRSGRPMQATIAFNVSFASENPRTALQVANEMTTLYLNKNLESRAEKASETAAFLQAEANRLSTEIAGHEAELATFKQENADRLPERTQFNLSLLDRAEVDLREVERQLRLLAERQIYLRSELSQLNPYSDLYSDSGQRLLSPADRVKTLISQIAAMQGVYGEQHPILMRRKRELESLQAKSGAELAVIESLAEERMARSSERAALGETYTADHPAVARLSMQIASLDEQIAAARSTEYGDVQLSELPPENPAYIQLQTQLEAAEAEQQSLRQRADELRERIVLLSERLGATPRVELAYQEFVRDLENARLQFRDVRAKEMEAQLAANLESGRQGERFTLIEPPLPPQRPVSPNRPVLFLLALFAAGATALGLVVAGEMLDSSIRDRDSLESQVGAATLGAVPRIFTEEDRRLDRRFRRRAAFAFAGSLLLAIVAVHYLYRPLDVLWFVALRKVGI
jgi:uncharacterized protein involved in exopolysaccharide biosynthesis